jgi:hypothetical protein
MQQRSPTRPQCSQAVTPLFGLPTQWSWRPFAAVSQTPPSQQGSDTSSQVDAQRVFAPLPSHSCRLEQAVLVGSPQAPRPSHRRSDSRARRFEAHLASSQTVPLACRRHLRAPSHMPSRPQVVALSALHSPSGSVLLRTGAHWPLGIPVALLRHDSHVPVQAAVQQIPLLPLISAQAPLSQSPSRVQLSPLRFRQAVLPVGCQLPPLLHSSSVVPLQRRACGRQSPVQTPAPVQR